MCNEEVLTVECISFDRSEVELLIDRWYFISLSVEEYYGADDEIAIDEAFNNIVDMMEKEGEISKHTADNMTREMLESINL